MSAQLIELIIFACIAYLIINKLLSALGKTYEDDGIQNKSFFGETGKIKDVTGTGFIKAGSILQHKFSNKNNINLKNFIVEEHEKEIKDGLSEVMQKLPSFNIKHFLKGAKAAFKMIINSSDSSQEELEDLIDARYIQHFLSISSSYGAYTDIKSTLTSKISEIYTFGNNIFIKILFTGKNITQKTTEFHEEWTFTKSTINTSPEWHLTNIDRPQ